MDMRTKPQIIALGGGGFSMEPKNPLLDQYILMQARKREPSVCFVPTASGDAASYIGRFYRAFGKHSCKTSHLSLFRPPEKLESFVLAQDIVYVGGGNTKNLLALWREWRLDRILRKAWRQGVVLCGVSAGSICWFEEGLTDSFGSRLQRLPCLGFLGGSNCPHYDGEPERQPRYRQLIGRGKMKSGIAADDGIALHYVGRKLMHVVSSRPDASAYSLRRIASGLIEKRLETRYLGKRSA